MSLRGHPQAVLRCALCHCVRRTSRRAQLPPRGLAELGRRQSSRSSAARTSSPRASHYPSCAEGNTWAENPSTNSVSCTVASDMRDGANPLPEGCPSCPFSADSTSAREAHQTEVKRCATSTCATSPWLATPSLQRRTGARVSGYASERAQRSAVTARSIRRSSGARCHSRTPITTAQASRSTLAGMLSDMASDENPV